MKDWIKELCPDIADWQAELIAQHAQPQQAEKQKPFGYFRYDIRLDAWVQSRDSNKGVAFYTTPQPQEEHHAKDCALLQIPSRDCDCSQNQEPVAEVAGRFGNMHIKFLPAGMFLQPGDLLYTAPQQREWVGLTKEDIAALLSTHYMYMEDFVVAVDAKIKEKNGWTS